jgi:hypothetical protein
VEDSAFGSTHPQQSLNDVIVGIAIMNLQRKVVPLRNLNVGFESAELRWVTLTIRAEKIKSSLPHRTNPRASSEFIDHGKGGVELTGSLQRGSIVRVNCYSGKNTGLARGELRRPETRLDIGADLHDTANADCACPRQLFAKVQLVIEPTISYFKVRVVVVDNARKRLGRRRVVQLL